MNSTVSAASLALAFGAALAVASTPAAGHEKPADKEKCFGVSLKGKNDCGSGAGTSCAGSSKVDYEGSAWAFVPKGTCEKTQSPTSPTGMGQLKAFAEKKSAS
jgi:uncharacterized membrane protein